VEHPISFSPCLGGSCGQGDVASRRHAEHTEMELEGWRAELQLGLGCVDPQRRGRWPFFYSQALPTVRRWRWEKSRWPGDFCRQPWPMAVQQHPRAHSVLGLASAQSELALAMGLDVPLLELACRRKITERKGGDFGKTTRQRQKYPARESFAGMREQCALCSGAVSTRCTGERYWSTARALGRKHTVAKYLAEELFARCHGRAAASTHHR
jgi:hypothetical protein